MAEYLIVKRERCSLCSGAGEVQTNAWADFWAERGPNWKPNDEDRAFMQTLGPEEITCPDCEGSGKIESMVNIEEVPLIKDFSRRLLNLEKDLNE